MLISDQLSVVREVQPSQGEQTEAVHDHHRFHVRSLCPGVVLRSLSVIKLSTARLVCVDREIEKYKGGEAGPTPLLDGSTCGEHELNNPECQCVSLCAVGLCPHPSMNLVSGRSV